MLGKVLESASGLLAWGPAESQEPRESALPAVGISNIDATAPRLTLGPIGQQGPESGDAAGEQNAGSAPSPNHKGTPIEIPVHASGRQAWSNL